MNIPHENLYCISLNAIQRSQKFICTDHQNTYIPSKFLKIVRHENCRKHESDALVKPVKQFCVIFLFAQVAELHISDYCSCNCHRLTLQILKLFVSYEIPK
jgi:hypothetical protein